MERWGIDILVTVEGLCFVTLLSMENCEHVEADLDDLFVELFMSCRLVVEELEELEGDEVVEFRGDCF